MASDTSDSDSDSEDEDSAEEEESGEPTTSGASDTDTDTDTDPTEDTSDTTGSVLEGPGCGPPPACDKGELVGSAQIQSAADIDMIAGYTSMTGWLEIDQTDLVCVDFLACLESVGHDITIFGNPDLADLSGFNALTGVGQATLDSPPAEKDGDISISQNPSLVTLNGFNAIEKVEQTLNITENDALTRITGFQELIWIVFDLNIQYNNALTSLEGLTGLRALENECIITNNAELCTSHTVDVCGDLEVPDSSMGEFPPGSTDNNKGC